MKGANAPLSVFQIYDHHYHEFVLRRVIISKKRLSLMIFPIHFVAFFFSGFRFLALE